MPNKVALVTGSNKGIGYEIVKELCKRGVGVVYLTSRNIERGLKAVDNLKKEGLNPSFHQLEVTDEDSVIALAKHLKQKHGGLDILVNNAAIINEDLYNNTYEDAKNLLATNYWSILTIEKYIFPLLKKNARVINISSDAGHISNIKNQEWIKRLTRDDIQRQDVNAFVNWYLNSLENGNIKTEDFFEMEILSYRISKVALCALTRVQQKEIGRNISLNSLHPGFVQTDMTKGVGILTLEESAKAPAYLALDVDQSVKGKYFWFDKTEKDWANPELSLHCKFELFEKHLKEASAI